MNSDEPTLNEMWWPSVKALDDLQVDDFVEGLTLSAPDGTECAEWLSFWSQSEEHHAIFVKAFTEMLRIYLDTLKNDNGENQVQPDGQNGNRVEAEEECPGVLP
jgi:hypothetical protein